MTNNFLKRLNQIPDDFEFWQEFQVYCKDFDIQDKNEFVDSLPILFNRIENDGFSYHFYQSLNKYSTEKPNDAIDILTLIEKKQQGRLLNLVHQY